MALYLGSREAKRKGLHTVFVPAKRSANGTHYHRPWLLRGVTTTSQKQLDHPVWVPDQRSLRSLVRDDSGVFDCHPAAFVVASPHRVEAPGQNALLRMQAILGFVEHHRL